MFERFTEDARRALFFARLEAHERGGQLSRQCCSRRLVRAQLGQRFVRPEHLILALLDEERAPVYHLLRDAGVDSTKISEFLRSDSND
jgi:ATP-dependent Clp protease ATP-binding subunit ClpA